MKANIRDYDNSTMAHSLDEPLQFVCELVLSKHI